MSREKFIAICQKSDVLIRLQTDSLSEVKDSSDTGDMQKNNANSNMSKSQSPQSSLLWKLYLGRKEALEAMNGDMEFLVGECLKSKRRLQCIEDSNRILSREMLSLRAKYEAILEKNKKDTNIIMALQNSESLLKQSTKKKEETSESLQKLQVQNKERALQRNLLRDERSRLLLKSQADSNTLNKINLKHQSIQEKIEEQWRLTQGDAMSHVKELAGIRMSGEADDGILEEWGKSDTERDVSIRDLQDDMKTGFTVDAKKSDDQEVLEEEADEAAHAEIESHPEKEDAPDETLDEAVVEEIDPREKALHSAWLKKKTLYDSALKQKEHWNRMYELMNKRLHDLNVELVNVRQWRLDKEAEKRELLNRTEQMEQLVSQKRRNKPVPTRSLIEELNIRIKVQRQINDTLRKIASNCLSVRVEDSAEYFNFYKLIRTMFVDALRTEENPSASTTDMHPSNEQAAGTED